MSTARAALCVFRPHRGRQPPRRPCARRGPSRHRRGDATAAAPRGGSERRGSRGRPLLRRGERLGRTGPRAARLAGLSGCGLTEHPSSSEPPAHGRGACARLVAHPAWLRVGARAALAAPASRPSPRRLPSLPPLRVLAPVCTDDSVVARPVLTCARSLALPAGPRCGR